MNAMKEFIRNKRKQPICGACQNDPDFEPYTMPNGQKTCIHLLQSKLWLHYNTVKKFSDDNRQFKKTHHYEVTLTTKPDTPCAGRVVVEKLHKFLTSKQFKPTESWLACLEHETTNAHVHIYANTTKYCPAKDVLKLNKARVSVSRLKTPLDVTKWKNYIHKIEDDKIVFENLEQIKNYLEKKSNIKDNKILA